MSKFGSFDAETFPLDPANVIRSLRVSFQVYLSLLNIFMLFVELFAITLS